jgi:transposase
MRPCRRSSPIIKKNWIWANENAWLYYGGATRGICPDNPKAAVTKACKYEPLLNETYDDLEKVCQEP